MKNMYEKDIKNLCEDLLKLKTAKEFFIFFKDLCTPKEIYALSERWRVCKLLHQGDLSYREIHRLTGASLTTIGRVARFLKDEPYQGYQLLLKKMEEK